MNTTEFTTLNQLYFYTQNSLFPYFAEQGIILTSKFSEVVTAIELSEIDKFVYCKSKDSVGRPTKNRIQFARAFVAKAVLNLGTTNELIERLTFDSSLRRICGFSITHKLPEKSAFSRAFKEFSEYQLPQRVHNSFVRKNLADKLFETVSHDSTAIEARESVKVKPKAPIEKQDAPKKKRGRPTKAEQQQKENEVKPLTVLQMQRGQKLEDNLQNLPKEASFGCKKNSKGFKTTWSGYKLHLSTVAGDIPVSCILTSASVHDSQVMIPLMQDATSKVNYSYDLADAAYCSETLREVAVELGHVALIDHNPRRGEKKQFEEFEALKYKERSGVERVNGHLKDYHGGRNIWVKGAEKVMAHLMFGILAITVEQTLKLVI